MSKSVTEQRSQSNIFVCERCKHQFAGYVANGNKRYCNDCRKEHYREEQRRRRNCVAFEEHVSRATFIIDNFLQDCRSSKSRADKKFIKISEILFWVKEHPDTIPDYWKSDMVIRRWITQTLKTNYPYKSFSTDVYIRVD